MIAYTVYAVLQPRPPSTESLSQILDSPPLTAVSHFASQAHPELTQPPLHNQSQPLVQVKLVTSPIPFKQPWPHAPASNRIQSSYNLPEQHTLQQTFRPSPLLSPKFKKLFDKYEQPQQSSAQAMSTQQPHQPKSPLPATKSQQNADQSQNPSHRLLESFQLPTKPLPQHSHGLPPNYQSPQLSPKLLHQLSRQSSGSVSPHDQSPTPFRHQPVSLSPRTPPSLAQSPQQARYRNTSADVLKLMTRDNFNILLFRITMYLGFIFDGQVDRKRYAGQSLATYHNQRHGATLQITDTFGPEIKGEHENSFPDLILMCLPVDSDVDVRRKENSTIRAIKRYYKNNIWDRVVIVLTRPDSEKNEAAAKLKRQADLEKYMKSLRIPTMPPFICISNTLTRDKLSDPKPTWYTELWSTIFRHCSSDGCPTLHVHLTDRLTGTSTTARSRLPNIPKESIEILEKRIEELRIQKAKDTNAHQARHKQLLWRS